MVNEAKTSDPRVHSATIQRMLKEICKHARRDIRVVNEPRFEALLETTVEVLRGLRKAYEHHDRGAEKAWKKD